ncbi:MAG: iron-sulfur cluster assembly scaffold protein [Acidobacteriota bacterium]
MYTERLLDHFRKPRNVGELGPPALCVDASNPACGDLLRLSVEFEDGVIKRARYKVKGCTASIAAGSVLTEWLIGKTAAEASGLTPAAIEEALGGLQPASKHAAVLCADAVRALLRPQRP